MLLSDQAFRRLGDDATLLDVNQLDELGDERNLSPITVRRLEHQSVLRGTHLYACHTTDECAVIINNRAPDEIVDPPLVIAKRPEVGSVYDKTGPDQRLGVIAGLDTFEVKNEIPILRA